MGGGECVPIVEVFRTLCILHPIEIFRGIRLAMDGWDGRGRSVERLDRGDADDDGGADEGWMDGWMDAVRAVRANETVGKVVVVVEAVVVDIVA